jgi:hypothetical protein
MRDIHIGETYLTYDGNHLYVKEDGQGHPTVAIPADELLILHNFIGSLLGLDRGQRQTFRLHRDTLAGLSCSVHANGQHYPVQVQDLSITGMHFLVKSAQGLRLSTSDKCSVNLTFQGESQIQAAVVNRQTESGFTVFFPNSLKGEEIEPPKELTNLVMVLQRRWLAKLAQFGGDGLV